ncbi:MAG TPA: PAS domain S-box protein, partial [Polyangia bacterium]
MSSPASFDLLGRLDAVVFEADVHTLRVTFAAGGALARLGFSAEECTGDAQFLVKRLHPDDREEFLARLREVASEGKEHQLEHRMVSADGQERWFRSEMHLVGTDRQVLGLMIDVTDARRTAEALREAEARLRDVITNAPVLLMALDAKGTFTLAEGHGLQSLGFDSSFVVGTNIFEAWSDETEVLAHVR